MPAFGVNGTCCALGFGLLSGCSGAEFDYHSSNLRISLDTNDPICSGTLDILDAHVDDVRDLSGLAPLDRPLDVFIYEGAPSSTCGQGVSGCYNRVSRRTHSNWAALEHELVHAATPWVPLPFLGEGHAVDLAGGVREFGQTFPDDNIPADRVRLDYQTAGHFVRWLRLEFGSTLLGILLEDVDWTSSKGYARARFSEIYGQYLSDLQFEYLASAPTVFPALDGHAAAFDLAESAERDFDLDFDCAAQQVQGHSGRRWVELDFTASSPTSVVFNLDSGFTALFTHRRLAPVQELGDLEYIGNEVVADEWLGGGSELQGGPHLVFFRAGEYSLRIETQDRTANAAHVSFSPSVFVPAAP